MYYLKRHIKPALIVVTVVSIFTALVVVMVRMENIEVRAVQSGESELWCHLHKGYQKIEPSNVKGLHSNGKWLFNDGGSARACEVVKLND